MIAWLCVIVILASVIWSLRLRGRPWYRNSYSQGVMDGWAITHVGHGMVLYGIAKMVFTAPMNQLLAMVIAVEALWESLENRDWVIRWFRQGGDKDYFGDSIANSCCDIAACAVGALITSCFIG